MTTQGALLLSLVHDRFDAQSTMRGRFSCMLGQGVRLRACRYATVHANTGALSELFSSGKAGTPVITQLVSGELLLAKDNIGIFIGSDGKPSRKVLPRPK